MKTQIALVVTLAVSTLQTGNLQANDDKPVHLLWEKGAPGAVGDEVADKPSLILYHAESAKATGAAIVVCPGGGYGHLAMDHEGHQVARWLNSIGVSAYVLKYRIAPRYKHPAPLNDVKRALRMARQHAAEWKIDPKRIGVLGFSAGGHLASTAGTHFDAGDPKAEDPIERVSSRPDFMVLVYPVITFTTKYTHRGSRRNLLGKEEPPELVEKLSSEKQVTAETPPTFLVHTWEDRGVPSENSVLFYLALRENGVRATMHIFEKGPHGFGLAPGKPVLSKWPELCAAWLRDSDFLGDTK